ncbi:MAG TPA: hypothetical protein PLU52_05105 [Opitutaceae bacterium]|nr:hypothetical protein [Opitutaceae bacterium]
MSKCDGWDFPASFGFTGSAGKTTVKGYMRGGAVRKNKVGAAGKIAKHSAAKGARPEREEMAEAPAMISPPPPPRRPVPVLNRAPMFGGKK